MRAFNILRSYLGFAAVFLALGCAGVEKTAKENKMTLEGPDWQLVELNGKAFTGGPGALRPNARFEGTSKRVSGTSGVNRYTGSYTVEGHAITFGPLAGTRMAGPAEAMELEREFLAAMAAVTGWQTSGRQLQLSAKDRVVIRFEGKEAPDVAK